MKQIKLFLFALFCVTFFACNKDTNNSTSSKEVKYEILTSVAIAPPSLGQIYRVGYINGTGQLETTDNFIAGQKSWTKTITITTASRPLNIQVAAPQTVFLSAPGTVTCNIYVGGKLKATTTNNSTSASGLHFVVSTPCYYIIQ